MKDGMKYPIVKKEERNMEEIGYTMIRRFWTVSMVVIAMILLFAFDEDVIACVILMRELIELSIEEDEKRRKDHDIA